MSGKWLGDNIDWLSSAALAVLAIIVSVVLYFLQRNRKTLDYTVLYSAPLLAHRARDVRDVLEVRVDGEVLEEPWLSVVKVKNTGRSSVQKEDYRQGIRFSAKGALPVSITVTSPGFAEDPSLHMVELPADGSQIIYPDLINGGEEFEVQVISDGDPEGIEVSARFVGQSRPMKATRSDILGWRALVIFGIAMALVYGMSLPLFGFSLASTVIFTPLLVAGQFLFYVYVIAPMAR